ncbi:MAG: protein kinase, partial [Myxococcota bacterium]|nr:protein kinase [Myxococcota bacterium]
MSEIVWTDDQCWLVTPGAAGPSLRDIVRTTTLSPEQVASVGAELLQALAHAHAANWLHGTLAPDVVHLVEDDGWFHPVIICFGRLALAPDALPLERYCAPEVLEGKALDARSDLYAIATVLSELLQSVLGADDVGFADVRRVLRRAQDLDPTLRFASASSCATAWAEVVWLDPEEVLWDEQTAATVMALTPAPPGVSPDAAFGTPSMAPKRATPAPTPRVIAPTRPAIRRDTPVPAPPTEGAVPLTKQIPASRRTPASAPRLRARIDNQPGPGVTVGNLVIEAHLRSTWTGEVFRAWDAERRGLVDVEFLELADMPSAEQEAILENAQRAFSLDHPGILRVLSAAPRDGRPAVVTPTLDGRALRERTGPIPPETVATIGAAVAKALHYAHEHGIVHGDVRPDTILLSAEDRPVVMHWGLARDRAQEAGLSPPN